MKCPNCGKEALFVNGKYVCVDCGIEITPEQQAAQTEQVNTVSDPAPAFDIQPEVSPESAVSAPEAPAEADNEVTTPSEETPVRDYFETAMSADVAQPATPQDVAAPQGSGIYDFSENENVSVPETPVDVPQAAPEADSLVSPEPAVEPAPAPEQPLPETEAAPNYFAPNSFDMSASPAEPVNTPVESTVPDFPMGDSAPISSATPEPEADLTVAPASNLDVPAEVPAEPAPIEPIVSPEPSVMPAIEPQPVATMDIDQQPVAQESVGTGQSLDEMLGGQTASPASAYTPVMDSISVEPQNGTPNQMPSVESVFGGDQTPPQNPNMPTAQDFGVTPPPVAKKKNIWPFVAIGAAVVVLVGVMAAVIIENSRDKTVAPVELTNDQVVSLSTSVTQAMSAPQGMSVGYQMSADFAGLSVKDDTKAGDVYRNYFAKNYTTSGTWSADSAGNIDLDATTLAIRDKRTYISKESATYIYSESTKKYTQKDGIQLVGIPAVFGAEEKAAAFYTTSIAKATDNYTETIDGVAYHKYVLVPSEELISNTLKTLGSVFDGVTYESLDTSKAVVTVWVTTDGKIGKIDVSGEVLLVTEKFEGKIILDGEAKYTYQEVTITVPGTVPDAANAETDTVTPAAATKTDTTEEGQTSSIVKEETPAPETDPVVEAKG